MKNWKSKIIRELWCGLLLPFFEEIKNPLFVPLPQINLDVPLTWPKLYENLETILQFFKIQQQNKIIPFDRTSS